MTRMFTLIWALGVALISSQAQAVTRMGEDTNFAGNPAVADWTSGRSSEQRKATHVSKAKRPHHVSRQAKRPHHASRHAKRGHGAAAYREAHRATEDSAASSTKVSRSRSRAKHAARHRSRTQESTSFFGQIITGIASYYWQPQRVASGGWFNPNAMTAAHKTLPFGTRVRVTHAKTGRSVDVTINDRGPYIAGRIIDLSSAAAGAIGMKSSGVATVKLEVLGK